MKHLVISLVLLMSAITVQAKDMNHRLGVGPKTPFSVATPAIAIHYFPNQDYAITGALAITTAEDSSQFGLQGGVRRILFEERNLNFFVGGTLGVLSYEVAGTNNSGFELTAVSGGEFFFEGLENLGFNFEMGFGVTSVKSSNTFATIARTPVNAGMIFYF